MKVDFDKVFRVGVDKITLYGFDVITNEKKKIIEETNKITEVYKNTIKEMTLTSSFIVNENGSSKQLNEIVFNPNRILFNNNVQNSREDEIEDSLIEIKKIWEEQNVFINFDNAKIKDIEVNKNYPVDYKEYFNVGKLFFLKLNNKKWSTSEEEDLEENMEKEEGYNYEVKRGYNKSKKKTVFVARLYDKKIEAQKKSKLIIEKDVLRIEFYLNVSFMMQSFKSKNLEHTIKNLIKHPDIIDEVFAIQMQNTFLKNIVGILKRRQQILEREYKYFKIANKLARQTKKTQEYNVYKHLDKYWVFDKYFVVEIIKKHDKAHKGQEIKKIYKHLARWGNIEKLHYLAEDFLSLNFFKLSDKNKNKNDLGILINKALEKKNDSK